MLTERLDEKKKIIICSLMGTDKSRIYYDSIKELRKKQIKTPACIIITGKLHFVEEEALKKLS